MYWRIRSEMNSFMEGLVAPILELIVSITIAAFFEMAHIIGSSIGKYGFGFINLGVEALNYSLLIMSFLDMVRNLYIGYSKPGRTLFMVMGEFLSLSLMYSIFIQLAPISFAILVLSIIVMIIGIMLRMLEEIPHWF